uniref:Uncharacterized protein n=1 Tax=Octopus bimaculoides TaxID=37653 RepID=A0A0L8HRN1_OCTBM
MTDWLENILLQMELTTNLRLLAEGHSDEREFDNYLLDVGNDNISVEQSLGEFKIKLPNDPCLESGTLSDLCDFVYADLRNTFTNPVGFANRTTVTPTNEAAQFVNAFLLTRIPGELKIYKNSDTVDNETLYPIEFVGKWLYTIRNLDATNGHGNGKHYLIVSLHDHVIEAEVAFGPHVGSTLLISRIPCISRNGISIYIYTQTISCQASFCLDVQQDTKTNF